MGHFGATLDTFLERGIGFEKMLAMSEDSLKDLGIAFGDCRKLRLQCNARAEKVCSLLIATLQGSPYLGNWTLGSLEVEKGEPYHPQKTLVFSGAIFLGGLNFFWSFFDHFWAPEKKSQR